MVNDQDFTKTYRGTRQSGGLDNVEYGNKNLQEYCREDQEIFI